MNCDRVRELVSDFLDGQLEQRDESPFQDHLIACAPCRAFEAELRSSLSLLDELPVVEVTDSFDEAVFAKIRNAEREARSASFWNRLTTMWEEVTAGFSLWKWSPVAVGAAVVMIALMTSGPESGEVATAPTPGVTTNEVLSSNVPGALARVETNLPEETVASIPEAVERYLQSQEQQDLRLSGREGLRKSDYTYPLRRVRDPAQIPVSSQVTPVSSEVISF